MRAERAAKEDVEEIGAEDEEAAAATRIAAAQRGRLARQRTAKMRAERALPSSNLGPLAQFSPDASMDDVFCRSDLPSGVVACGVRSVAGMPPSQRLFMSLKVDLNGLRDDLVRLRVHPFETSIKKSKPMPLALLCTSANPFVDQHSLALGVSKGPAGAASLKKRTLLACSSKYAPRKRLRLPVAVSHCHNFAVFCTENPLTPRRVTSSKHWSLSKTRQRLTCIPSHQQR